MVYRYHFEAWPGTTADECNKLVADISTKTDAEGADTYTDFSDWVKLNHPDRFTQKEIQALYISRGRYECIQFIEDVSEKIKAAGIDSYTVFCVWAKVNLADREFTLDELQELYNEIGHFRWAKWKIDKRNRVFGVLIRHNLPRNTQRLLKSWDGKSTGCWVILLLVCVSIFGYPYARSALSPKPNPPELSAEQLLALMVEGDWEAVGGTVHLSLNEHDAVLSKNVTDDGKTIELIKNVTNDNTVESRGTWTAGDHTVQIHLAGPAGRLDVTMEYTPGADVEVLSPVPKNAALVTNCWFRHNDSPDASDYDDRP